MTSASAELVRDQLLQHESFVRRTLRGLLRDESRVDDALQETWLQALRRPPARAGDPRPWLARVARNVARSSWRSESRRRRREALAHTAGEVEGVDESCERLEARQRVVSAVLALDEPYRSVVLLRYEHDLAHAAIARRLGRSEATVRSQLSRAQELLRGRLDAEFGDRRHWVVLAGPLSGGLSWSLLAAGAAAVVAAGSWAVWGTGAAGEPALAAAAVAPTLEASAAPAPASLEASAARARSPVEPSRVQAVPQGNPNERELPPAELFDRDYYEDHGRASFSFEHGLRDDPGLTITRNDWGVVYGRDELRVKTVTDDHSRIARLGAFAPGELTEGHFEGLRFTESARVYPGYSYFIWSRDGDTDLACLVYVREHEPERRVLLDWYATDGSGRAQGSLADDEVGTPLADLLVLARAQAAAGRGLLEFPQVVLQARNGAGGGNTQRIHMNGDLTRIRTLSEVPLDLVTLPQMSERGSGYFEGGYLRRGTAFVVTHVTYRGTARGDTNGGGRLLVVIGGETIVDERDTDELVHGTWVGRIALRPGDEERTYLGIANSSAGEVRLEGAFEDTDPGGSFGAPNRGFLVTRAPDPVPTVPLAAPRAVLQVRSGAGGGNPNRVDLTGHTSIYVDRVAEAPLEFLAPPAMDDDSVVYFEGGHVPAGHAFVVTSVAYSGSSAGDTNGDGEFRLVVAGEVIFEVENGATALRDRWHGRLRIVPGEESRTYLEIANSSAGDVLLSGYFEAL
jgi:RNA polymerase sigma-70 factor (ECF subfamily)